MKRSFQWDGYTDYRYGSKKTPTLKRVFSDDKKKQVVSQVMELMKDWRASQFENEGPIRHSLRSSLCQDGHGWAIADHEAELVVSETFRLMGIHRPTWEQGQRQYTIALECCQWCSVEIAEEDRTGIRKARFCSSVCAKSAIVYRDYLGRKREDAVARSALAIMHRDKAPEQTVPIAIDRLSRSAQRPKGNGIARMSAAGLRSERFQKPTAQRAIRHSGRASPAGASARMSARWRDQLKTGTALFARTVSFPKANRQWCAARLAICDFTR